ncbi:MAG TPA: hypothetical protein VJV79_32300, partial [Polyangiaceae bacterium]|nr:hypothetical protein [Polyangiaceae bacterium]
GSGGAMAGSGGAMAGSGGAAAGSGGAAAGSGGSAGQTTATGCAKLTVPYSVASQVGTFGALSLNGVFDLTNATIDTKIYVATQGSAAVLQYLLEWTNAASVTCTAYVGYTSIPAILSSGFGTYTLMINTTSVPATTNGYCNGVETPLDRTKIKSIGIQLTGSPTATPATSTVWLDSITVSGANPTLAAPITFDSAAPFTVYTYNGPTPPATAVWQATCP